ncbi:MAG TPA: hypothetical protein VF506_11820, partial [Streptosporangiaceae bacterium]
AAGARTATAGVRESASFGRAITVPGLAALNTGRNANVLSVSCPSPGKCAAGGSYKNHGIKGFVVSQKNGRWGKAIQVPGLAALNKGGQAEVLSVSCASPGRCAAGGFYGNHGNPFDPTSGRGFVVSEQNGRWGKAVQVPGLAALNKGGNAEVNSVSCAPPGYCAAVGFYTDADGHRQGFVAIKSNGVWGRAVGVPGLTALNKGGNADVNSVSCASPGNCAAGGYYYSDSSGHREAFVASENDGSWGTAQQVAGNLNVGKIAGINSVSCASAGNCSAGGGYRDGSENYQAFVISEVNGSWAAAQEVAGNLNSNGLASVDSVSCASPGNCSAGGDYDYDYNFGFVVSEKNGVWGKAINVPGLGKLAFRFSDVMSVSCASAGNCAAGGDYETPGGSQGFVAVQKNGVWTKAITVPGLGSLKKGRFAGVESVSCATAGSCTAGGYYSPTDRRITFQGFLT